MSDGFKSERLLVTEHKTRNKIYSSILSIGKIQELVGNQEIKIETEYLIGF